MTSPTIPTQSERRDDLTRHEWEEFWARAFGLPGYGAFETLLDWVDRRR